MRCGCPAHHRSRHRGAIARRRGGKTGPIFVVLPHKARCDPKARLVLGEVDRRDLLPADWRCSIHRRSTRTAARTGWSCTFAHGQVMHCSTATFTRTRPVEDLRRHEGDCGGGVRDPTLTDSRDTRCESLGQIAQPQAMGRRSVVSRWAVPPSCWRRASPARRRRSRSSPSSTRSSARPEYRRSEFGIALYDLDSSRWGSTKRREAVHPRSTTRLLSVGRRSRISGGLRFHHVRSTVRTVRGGRLPGDSGPRGERRS